MEVVAKQKKLTMMQQLDDIMIDVSWRQIAQDYFGKSSSWIYNKLHGRDGNGGVVQQVPLHSKHYYCL